jgi:hypothetical protein
MTTNKDTLQSSRNFVLLAPLGSALPGGFGTVHDDFDRHSALMSRMQQLRGRLYLDDGAIAKSDLDSQGRHHMPGDEASWHLLRMRADASLSGCARILAHPSDVSYSELRLASSALARCTTWGRGLRATMEAEIAKAREVGKALIEPGGWALAEDLRGSTEALSIAIGALAWAQLLGGCAAFMTATVRHGSSSFLRRMGGVPVEVEGRPSPAYFDPDYGCEMELLRFDSQALNPRFNAVFDKTRRLLVGAPVIVARAQASNRKAA